MPTDHTANLIKTGNLLVPDIKNAGIGNFSKDGIIATRETQYSLKPQNTGSKREKGDVEPSFTPEMATKI